LSSSRNGGETIKDYVSEHYQLRSQPTKDEKIGIENVVCFPLRIILFIIAILANSAYLHVVNMSHMEYALECPELTIFN